MYCRTCDLASQKSIIQFVERFNSGKFACWDCKDSNVLFPDLTVGCINEMYPWG